MIPISVSIELQESHSGSPQKAGEGRVVAATIRGDKYNYKLS